jgi:HSP20 family molecular chaperone IbpA
MSTTITKNEISQNGKEQGEYPQAESTYQQTFVPRIDIWEGKDELVLHADMPGVKTEDLDVRFEDNQLTIHGKVSDRHENVRVIHTEYSVGDFHRTFTIGESIDVEKISAELSCGVLTLHLPKSEKVKPRRISVKAK